MEWTFIRCFTKLHCSIKPNTMRTIIISISALLCPALLFAQQQMIFDSFDGNKIVCYPFKTVNLDTNAKNPAPNQVNKSALCAKYTRNPEKKFDNIKMCLNARLSDVSPYATYTGAPPKIKMKVYTSAPPGTLVEILLGSKGRSNEFPEGTHSQYQAYTTKSNVWEEIEFKFSQIPKGSDTGPNQIDQVTLLFNPNSANADVYYFDEITGPLLVPKAEASSVDKKEKK